MAIELSNLTFTNQADVVPVFGMEQIFNSGIANTLAGNDRITGIRQIGTEIETFSTYGIYNDKGIIDTDDGNDIITGINQEVTASGYGIYSEGGTINTGNGNDIINGISENGVGAAIQSENGTINTGDGDDTIMGNASHYSINLNYGTLDTGKGNDIITATGFYGISNYNAIFNTGDGNDIINGNSIAEQGAAIINSGPMDTGDGNDIITGTNASGGAGILNLDSITLGNGNDIIIGKGAIYGMYNKGTIDTGNGADSIIVDGGFETSSDERSLGGNVFLGNGQDYLKGFGSGNFNGGNGKDTLELTPGRYTIEKSETGVIFTQPSSRNSDNGTAIMKTSGFEILIAGSTIYNFASLTNDQVITVA
jgi:hypothetical protein